MLVDLVIELSKKIMQLLVVLFTMLAIGLQFGFTSFDEVRVPALYAVLTRNLVSLSEVV